MGTWHGTLGEWVTLDFHPHPGLVLGVYWCVIDLLELHGGWGGNWGFVQTLLLSQPSWADGTSIPVPSHGAQFLPPFPVLAAPFSQGGCWGTMVAHPDEDEGLHQPHLLLLCRFAAAPGLKVWAHPEVIKHRSSFCCSCINPVLKHNLKRLKILLTEINFSWRTFDLRDSSFHFQIHYPILNYGFYYKSLFLHSL